MSYTLLETWPFNEDFRLMNNGQGNCNTGSGMERICELGGIGCNVDHKYVMLRNILEQVKRYSILINYTT